MKTFKRILFLCLVSAVFCVAFACNGTKEGDTYSIKVTEAAEFVEYNGMLKIPAAKIVDSKGNEAEGEISVLAKDSNGDIVATSFTEIKCRVIGDYVITYSSDKTDDLEIKIVCGDHTAPVVKLKNFVAGGIVDQVFWLPDVIYEDSSEMNYDLTTLDLYYNNNGVLEACRYNKLLNNFTPDKVGTYLLKSHAVDEYGNAADDTWTFDIDYYCIDYRVSYWAGGPWTTNSNELENIVTKETVREATTVIGDVTIEKYDKFTVDYAHVWTMGAFVTVDLSKIKKCDVTIYIKAEPSCHLCIFNKSGDTWPLLFPTYGEWLNDTKNAYVESYDAETGWSKVVFSKIYLEQNNGALLIGCQDRNAVIDANGDHANLGNIPNNFTVDTVICFSPVYFTDSVSGEKEYRISYWNDTNASWITDTSGLSDKATKETVNESVTVENGVTIDRYDKMTATYFAVWTMGIYLSVDMDKVTDKGIALYMKTEPNSYFCLFRKSGDSYGLLYPVYGDNLNNSYNDPQNPDGTDYVASYDAETGWSKIVFSKEILEANNGFLLIGVQDRTGDHNNFGNIPNNFAKNTVWFVSDIVY